MYKSIRGFTLVELLIVITVIGILAAVVFVAFNTIQARARVASLTSDLLGASKQLKLDATTANAYPVSVAAANGGKGLKSSPGNSYRYSVDNTANPQTFCLTATDGARIYSVTESKSPAEGGCVNVALGASAPNAVITDGATTPTSFYSGASGLQSVTVSLASAQDVSSIKVWHYYSDGRTYNATKTEVSEDGSTWTKVFDSSTSGTYAETSSGKTHSFPVQKVRYIRDWINGSSANSGNHWVEIQAF